MYFENNIIMTIITENQPNYYKTYLKLTLAKIKFALCPLSTKNCNSLHRFGLMERQRKRARKTCINEKRPPTFTFTKVKGKATISRFYLLRRRNSKH